MGKQVAHDYDNTCDGKIMHCFFCLNKISRQKLGVQLSPEKESESVTVTYPKHSIKTFARYLNLNQALTQNVERSNLKVTTELCEGCANIYEKFSKLQL